MSKKNESEFVDNLQLNYPLPKLTKPTCDWTLKEFGERLQQVRARHGWAVTIECRGVWLVKVEDKETGEVLIETGTTSLDAVAWLLCNVPLNEWHDPKPGRRKGTTIGRKP